MLQVHVIWIANYGDFVAHLINNHSISFILYRYLLLLLLLLLVGYNAGIKSIS